MIIQESTVKRMARIQKIWKERESVKMKTAWKVEYSALKQKIRKAGIQIREYPNYLTFEVSQKVENAS